MACALIPILIFISLGIQRSFAASVTNYCGTLSYDEPAVVGRSVTITFQPVKMVSSVPVKWLTISGWRVDTEQWNYHLDNFSLVINMTADDKGRWFYVDYGVDCYSGMITLKLEVIDINSCGYWYESTSNERPGGIVELGYFPTWNIINNEANYDRIFVCDLDDRTVSFNVSSPINLTESSTTVVECTAKWATTVRWLDSDTHTALLVSDCGIGAACLQLDDVNKKQGGNYTCLANDSWFNVSKQLTVTVERLPDRNTSAKTDDQTSSTIIGSSMACIVLLLAAIILGVVLKRRNSRKSEMVQNSNTVPIAGPSSSVVSYAGVQESDIYSTPLPKSQRPKADNSKTVQVDDTYAMLLPKSQRNNANTANVKFADAPKLMIYTDLDLQPSSTSGAGAMAKPVVRKDGPETEYVDIDLNKKTAPLPDSEEEDNNVYANQ